MPPLNTAELRQKLDEPNPFTEDALALRFSAQYANTLRYIATKGQWQFWNGERWYGEQTYLAFELARRSCREAARDGNPPNSILAAKTIAAVERMAKADRRQATTIEQWDADDWAFNAKQEQ
jgi:putative DNA primase/helicase